MTDVALYNILREILEEERAQTIYLKTIVELLEDVDTEEETEETQEEPPEELPEINVE